MDFEKVLSELKSFYYSQLVMAFFEITAIILAFIHVKKSKIGKLFIFYLLLDFFILLTGVYLHANPDIPVLFWSNFVNVTNITVALVEFLVYYYFFSKVLYNQKIKSALYIISISFFLVWLTYLFTHFSFITPRKTYFSYLIGVVEFILLLPPCILFYFQLLKINSSLPLLKRPSFWIVTGVFFFALISIPYYLLNNYIIKEYKEYYFILSVAFFYIPFTLNFIFLSKAFICKKPLTI